MAVNLAAIRELREMTGMGISKCKAALEKAGGDTEAAVKELLKEGARIAERKTGRVATEGVVSCYSHFNLRIGAMVELRCETDFVARNEEFRAFADDLAMQVAAHSPLTVRREELPEELIERKREEMSQDIAEKPPQIQERIIKGRMENFYKEVCLLDQTFIKDDSVTVQQLMESLVGKLRENIHIARFVRYQLGEQEDEASV